MVKFAIVGLTVGLLLIAGQVGQAHSNSGKGLVKNIIPVPKVVRDQFKKKDGRERSKVRPKQEKEKQTSPQLAIDSYSNAEHLKIRGVVINVRNVGTVASQNEFEVEYQFFSTKAGEIGKTLRIYRAAVPPLPPTGRAAVVIPIPDPTPEGSNWDTFAKLVRKGNGKSSR